MHVPTGLFVHAAYGIRRDDGLLVGDDTSTQLYVQGGIEQNFFGIGKTTLFGEYQKWDIGARSTLTALPGVAGVTTAAEMTMWGLGFNQAIDAAAMDLYVRYNNFDAEQTQGGVSCSPSRLPDHHGWRQDQLLIFASAL